MPNQFRNLPAPRNAAGQRRTRDVNDIPTASGQEGRGFDTAEDAAVTAMYEAIWQKQEAERHLLPRDRVADPRRHGRHPNERFAGIFQNLGDDKFYRTSIEEAQTPLGGDVRFSSPFALETDIHTHPATPGGEDFSPTDKHHARTRSRPRSIYMAQFDERESMGMRGMYRYDPQTDRTNEVLGHFPMEEYLFHLMNKHPSLRRLLFNKYQQLQETLGR